MVRIVSGERGVGGIKERKNCEPQKRTPPIGSPKVKAEDKTKNGEILSKSIG